MEWDDVPRHMSSTWRRISLALFIEGLSVSPGELLMGEMRVIKMEIIVMRMRGIDSIIPFP